MRRLGQFYHYDDVFLVPRYSEVKSRKECDVSVEFGKYKFRIPVVPANMKSVIDEKVATLLNSDGYFYIMHRFGVNLFDFVKSMKEKCLLSSISVGVNRDSIEQLKELVGEGLHPDFITIDIAHGHCIKMKDMISRVRGYFSEVFIIAGNVCTSEGARTLDGWGADAIKVGIASGFVCTTKLKTGFSYPQFSAVLECSAATDKPVIADGGIVNNGDIAKAIAAGATMVMAGKLFAGLDELPGDVPHIKGAPGESLVLGGKKIYYGSASEYNKGEKKNVEGKLIYVDNQGSLKDKLREIKEDLQSSVSYAGGNTLDALKKTNWIPHNG